MVCAVQEIEKSAFFRGGRGGGGDVSKTQKIEFYYQATQHFRRSLSETVHLFLVEWPVWYLIEMPAIALFRDLDSPYGKIMASLLILEVF